MKKVTPTSPRASRPMSPLGLEVLPLRDVQFAHQNILGGNDCWRSPTHLLGQPGIVPRHRLHVGSPCLGLAVRERPTFEILALNQHLDERYTLL
jgi:hypothetical protein